MYPHGAKDGQVLVRTSDGWKWVDLGPRTRSQVPAVLVMLALVLGFVLATVHFARADASLPFGVTCDQVTRYASDLNIPNTWRGRMQARIIALSFGHVLTNRELEAAARCLRSAQAGAR